MAYASQIQPLSDIVSPDTKPAVPSRENEGIDVWRIHVGPVKYRRKLTFEPFINAKAAARHFGSPLKQFMLLVKQGRVPGYKCGKTSYLFRMSDFKNFELPKVLHPHVYVMQCNEFHKIGVAADVFHRLITIQTSCPYRVKLLFSAETENAYDVEEQYHRQFKEFRGMGEWFKLSDEHLWKIRASMCKRGSKLISYPESQ